MSETRTKFTLWCNGDPSVGIPGDQAEVLVWVDPNDPEHLPFVKETLVEAFRQLWDEDVYVITEAERAKLPYSESDPDEAYPEGSD